MALELTVMTYNVHSCKGTDGKVSPYRIAEAIARHSPDVAALQELDSGLVRTGLVDQAEFIASELNMHYHFHPALHIEAGQYGNAVLTRFPTELHRAAELPTLPGRRVPEKRGAIWVKLKVQGREVQVFNTHLGLNSKERLAQAVTLAGGDWLGHPSCVPPVVFCGDLNAAPWSSSYRILEDLLVDVQRVPEGWRPRRTWPGRLPLRRLDYIFASPDIAVREVIVPRDALARAASDHLPVVARIEMPEHGHG